MNITGQLKQKFIQADLLEKLKPCYGASAEDKEAYECIKDGICYMLSIEWLLKLMETPNAYPDSIYNTQFENQKVLMYYKQIANNFYKYASDYKFTFQKIAGHPGSEQLQGNSMVDIHNKFVASCSNSKYLVENSYGIYNSPVDLTNVYTGNCALLLCLNVIPLNTSVNGFAHAMAIWRYQNKNYFYDPNQGVFQVSDLSNIVGEIIAGYTAYVPNGASAKLTITKIIEK